MKKNIISISLILISFVSFSQDIGRNYIDSLLCELRYSKEDNTNPKDLNENIVNIFRLGVPEDKEAFKEYILNTIEISNKLNDKYELANASYYMGKLYISSNNGYAKAIPFLLEGLSLFEEINDSAGISKCYMQLGLISYITQYYEDAIKNLKLSIEYFDNPTSTYLLGISYSEIGNFSESKKYFFKALDEYSQINNLKSINECYMYLGNMYDLQGSLDSAFYYINLAIKNISEQNDIEILSRPYALISGFYLKKNDIDSAIYYANISYEISKKGNDKISEMHSTEVLSKAYEILGNFTLAHSYLKIHNTLESENIKGNTKQKITEMQSMFDFKKKINDEILRHQEELHQKNRTKNYILASGLFILLIAGGLYSRLDFIRKSRAEIRKEKDISEGLLLNILPSAVADELKEKGYTDAKQYEQGTILFTDFKGFTSMSEIMEASDLVAEIDECFKSFDYIMEKYNIEKIKTIGDAYMAAGGLHIPRKTEPHDVINAALEMQEFILSRKIKHDEIGVPSFDMRVGIHSGPVIAGVVGIKKFQYDIWGDTVNTASRMESNGEVGKVNISQFTFEKVKDSSDFIFESRKIIDVKGKGEMQMYFVSRKV